MTRAEVIAWLRSLPKGERYQQAQVYSKPGVREWSFDVLLHEASHTLDCAIFCKVPAA